MARILIDTDILVDVLRGARRLVLDPQDDASYSVVTRCELFSGRDGNERGIKELLEPFGELPIDRTIAERAGRIRRTTGLRTPDALIAATALEHRVHLLSRNHRDFQRVRGLRLADTLSE